MKEKLFVVRKYIKAKSILDAIKKEKEVEPDDIWVDDDWKKQNDNEETKLTSAVGFKQ